ncbi:MAG: glucosaminidase domain-containing protein [Clostridiaceae bacterium]
MKFLRKTALTFFIATTVAAGSVSAAGNFTEISSKSNVVTDKKWTITFNSNLDKDTINDENITVTDAKGNKVKASVSIGATDNTVTVMPKVEGYLPGSTYYINFGTGIKSLGGKTFSSPKRMKFVTTGKFSDASTYEGIPNIVQAKMEYEPILPNQKQTFHLKSSSSEQVQYRIFASKYVYKFDKYEPYEEITNGYVSAQDGKITTDKLFEAGENGEKYKILIYVKRANKQGAHVDENTDYDNYYIDYLRCVNSVDKSIFTDLNLNFTFNEALDKQNNTKVSVTDEGPTSWMGASANQIKYYMNPSNFTDEYGKYMFLKLNYIDDSITEDDLNKILKGKGVLEGKGKAFLEGAKENNINPAYLVSHALLETASGTSKLATGIEVDGKEGKKKVYNTYGIKAFDDDPNKHGSEYAYEQKWFTVEEAITGGAKYIAEKYVNNPTVKRDTLYKMRWNPSTPGSYQYATDIGWAYKQVIKIKELMDQCENPTLKFEFPVFKK